MTVSKQYGNHGPIVVKAGSLSYMVIRDPNHVRAISEASERVTTDFERVEVYDKVLGAPKSTLQTYKNLVADKEAFSRINSAHYDLPQKHLTGPALVSLANIYTSALSRNMSNKMFQLDSWTQIEDFWSFFETEITRVTIETLFGTALLKQYPKITQDFWKFQANVEHFIPGLPRFAVSSVDDVRDRILEGIKKWLQTTHGGTDFAKIGKDDPVWDESRGSKYIQERDEIFSKMPAFNYQGRAVEVLSVVQR
jgi:hypothetical protein